MWWEGKQLSLLDEISESDSYSCNKSQRDALCESESEKNHVGRC